MACFVIKDNTNVPGVHYVYVYTYTYVRSCTFEEYYESTTTYCTRVRVYEGTFVFIFVELCLYKMEGICPMEVRVLLQYGIE